MFPLDSPFFLVSLFFCCLGVFLVAFLSFSSLPRSFVAFPSSSSFELYFNVSRASCLYLPRPRLNLNKRHHLFPRSPLAFCFACFCCSSLAREAPPDDFGKPFFQWYQTGVPRPSRFFPGDSKTACHLSRSFCCSARSQGQIYSGRTIFSGRLAFPSRILLTLCCGFSSWLWPSFDPTVPCLFPPVQPSGLRSLSGFHYFLSDGDAHLSL